MQGRLDGAPIGCMNAGFDFARWPKLLIMLKTSMLAQPVLTATQRSHWIFSDETHNRDHQAVQTR
jgi:hypothetical protein